MILDTAEFLHQHLECRYPEINKTASRVMDLLAEEGLLICEAREVLREVSSRLELVKLPLPQKRDAGRACQQD